MARLLFKNCRVWDGSGAAAYPADVLIEGDRIRAVATQRGQLEAAGAETIEANGMTLMPGLVEGHAHITFINARARHRPRRHAAGGAHADRRAQRAPVARSRLHQRVQRGQRQAADRRGDPQRHRGRRPARPAHARLRSGDHRHRRAWRRAPRAPVPRQLRHRRRRAGGGDQAGAALRARGRGQHQAEHLRRRPHPHRRLAAHGDERGRNPRRRHAWRATSTAWSMRIAAPPNR